MPSPPGRGSGATGDKLGGDITGPRVPTSNDTGRVPRNVPFSKLKAGTIDMGTDDVPSSPSSSSLLPEDQEFLATHPRRGQGLHFWLMKAAHRLHRAGLEDSEIIEVLHGALAGESLQPNEVQNAVANLDWKPNEEYSGSWPALDERRRDAVVTSGKTFVALCDLSPVALYEDRNYAEVIADAIFPGDPLVCGAFSKRHSVTKLKSEWRGQFARLEFIVPHFMTARRGKTQEGLMSARSLENTGPRRFVVLDQDTGTLDEQAAIILHLAEKAPLAMVLHSGGKSLHAWFYCAGQSESLAYQFMRDAVSLGCDRATWTKSQLVRAPDGLRRENRQRQTIHFFNPDTIR